MHPPRLRQLAGGDPRPAIKCDVAASYRRVRRVLISIASSRASQQTIIRPQKPATYRSDIISKRISPSYSMGRTRPDAKATFISDCRKENAQPRNPATSPPPTNAQSSELQDQQSRKWDAAARRAIGSICVGCDTPVRSSRSPTRRPAPVADTDDLEPD